MHYQYDPNGRIQSITATINGTPQPIASNIQYAPFGHWLGYHAAHGTPVIRSYDTDGRVNGLSLNPDTLRGLQYDANNRITQTDDYLITNPQASNPNRYGYDNLDRLISHNGNHHTRSYSYDANSNRTGRTDNGTLTSTTIATTSHRINSKGTKSYQYDAAGNTTGDGNNQFSYNANGRMASSTNQNGLTTTYQYNALGQRIKKHNSNETTHLAYDAQGHIIGEYDATGNPNQETIWLYDTPIAVIKHNQVYAIYTDHLDTPRIITDASHQTVWAWDNSEAFGDTPANEDPNNTGNLFTYNLRFPGQLYDSETGTHYNYFRDNYAPKDGRYYQSDPIGLEGGINTYGYVGGNPLWYTDEEGLAPKSSGGPYHPPKNVKLSCNAADTCSSASSKAWVLQRMIRSHQGWDWNNPSPRGGGRHAAEISDLWRALANCVGVAAKKCVGDNCNKIPRILPAVPLFTPIPRELWDPMYSDPLYGVPLEG